MTPYEAYLVPDPKAPGIRWDIVWKDPSKPGLLRAPLPSNVLPTGLDGTDLQPVAVTVLVFAQGAGASAQYRFLPPERVKQPHSWQPGEAEGAPSARPSRATAPSKRETTLSLHPRKSPRNFHNPYNFVPAPEPVTDPALAFGQRAPVGHHVYHEDLWSGEIGIELETVTPLLIPDAATARPVENTGHMSFATRRILRDGKEAPLLPATSLKGVLRSLYEAATNSRFGVFEGHDARLGRRPMPNEALALKPARVVEEDGVRRLEVFQEGAAWLPLYGERGWDRNFLGQDEWSRIDGDNGEIGRRALALHGAYCEGEVEDVLRIKHVWDRTNNKFKPPQNLRFSEVKTLTVTERDPLDMSHPEAFRTRNTNLPSGRSKSIYTPQGSTRRFHGYICVTNRNFTTKHDERVFYWSDDAPPVPCEWNSAWDSQWSDLIGNYRQVNKDAMDKRGKNEPGWRGEPHAYLGNKIGEQAFSRHMHQGTDKEARRLAHGDLVYADLRAGKVVALYPVQVSRRLFERAPAELLPETLHPAENLSGFSPADRLFGWVRGRSGNTAPKDGSDRAYRGHLRVAPIECRTEKAIKTLNVGTDGLPLAILGQPKPQQARFYVAEDRSGRAPADGDPETAKGYDRTETGLRGRKVYPHQKTRAASLAAYWDATEAARVARGEQATDGLAREHVRLPEENNTPKRDSQNRSMRDWIRPGVQFSTTIRVTNISKAELGALLWLLGGEAGHLRLGGGKPLGFGSSRVAITRLDLCTGAARRQVFRAFLGTPTGEGVLRAGTGATSVQEAIFAPIDCFKSELLKAWPQPVAGFDEIPAIKALKRAGHGHDDNLPTHYPRMQQDPDPAGENFRWFAENDKNARVVLADLEDDPGLPLGVRQGTRGKGRR